MPFGSHHVIYPCQEHSEVSVPIADLLNEQGALDIYPDISGKGYFDIDYRKGKLILKSKGFVGLIPISERVAIRVEPRTSIANLMYMIWRAGGEMTSLEGYVRSYQDLPGRVADPGRLYVNTFISAMGGVRKAGLLKQYLTRSSVSEMRGRLLLNATVSLFRSHGVKHQHSFEVNEHTVNNLPNRILKATAERLLQRAKNDTGTFGKGAVAALRELVHAFDPVDVGSLSSQVIARETPRIIRGLPNSHRCYESALWLAYLIATNSGIVMEAVGCAKFESVIIDVASVFEKYVRKLCEEHAAACFAGCYVVDGNAFPLSLFVRGIKTEAKPDIYFKRRSQFVAVADAKYKSKISTEDRYELLAFCEAMQVGRAAFVVPQQPGQLDTSLHGMTVGGRTIHVVSIDLSAAEHSVEEARFTACLGKTLGF